MNKYFYTNIRVIQKMLQRFFFILTACYHIENAPIIKDTSSNSSNIVKGNFLPLGNFTLSPATNKHICFQDSGNMFYCPNSCCSPGQRYSKCCPSDKPVCIEDGCCPEDLPISCGVYCCGNYQLCFNGKCGHNFFIDSYL